MILLLVFVSVGSIVTFLTLAMVIRASVLRLQINDITSKYVFITGCDTGFGNLLARKLDKNGANVFAGCLTAKGARDLSDVTSSRLVTVPIDVSVKDSVAKAYETVKTKLPENTGKLFSSWTSNICKGEV